MTGACQVIWWGIVFRLVLLMRSSPRVSEKKDRCTTKLQKKIYMYFTIGTALRWQVFIDSKLPRMRGSKDLVVGLLRCGTLFRLVHVVHQCNTKKSETRFAGSISQFGFLYG
jgi:hypothetical protein